MKVRCIKEKNDGIWLVRNKFTKKFFWSKKKPVYETGPKYNDIVTVKNDKWIRGVKYYELIEWPGDLHEAKCFVPLEEKSEKITFKEIKEKASVN